MARVRPLVDLPGVVGQVSVAIDKSQRRTVERMTSAVRRFADNEGGKFSLRGANGDRVKLGASSDVKPFRRSWVGQVRGVPAGFWRIVEDGSNKHLIAGRYRAQRGIGPRLKQGGTRSRFRRFIQSDGEITGFSPVFMPGISRPGREGKKAYSQFVVHPGHRSLGRPWRTTLRKSEPVVADIQARETTQAIVGAFQGIRRAA